MYYFDFSIRVRLSQALHKTTRVHAAESTLQYLHGQVQRPQENQERILPKKTEGCRSI